MTLREALKHFKTKSELAAALDISKQAVSSWPLDEPIPEARELKLRYEILPQLEVQPENSAA
jgi:DNA-binding XRE family transcriptional regulator